MKNTIEKLWNGQITPCENCGENDPQLQELVELLARNRESLDRELNDRQKETLQKYIDCSDEYCYLLSAQAFCDGFCLACRLLTETFSE